MAPEKRSHSSALLSGYRLLAPVINVLAARHAVLNLLRYPRFVRDFVRYREMNGSEPVLLRNLWPQLRGAHVEDQIADAHYFYQDTWALRKLAASSHRLHVDVGSRLDGFVAQATALKRVVFLDFRIARLELDGLAAVAGDLLRLPFRDGAIASLSCLHVVEHVGLGRYGDKLEPRGTERALAELQRALAPGGDLYLGVPVGRPAVYFNAHRVLSPTTILALCSELELLDFSAVDDDGRFCREARREQFEQAQYACGLFHFRKPA